MMDVNLEHVKALAELANQLTLAEITITDGDKQITIKTPASVAHTVHQAVAPTGGLAPAQILQAHNTPHPASHPASAEPPASTNYTVITSPMVGTFYAASSPEADPLAPKGSTIRVGQTLCVLEAMKQMNAFESEHAGVVADVLVTNGQPVEYGQPLFHIQPA
jgi:acetyl-CoA carboxylase biotin carboxyl carrier protein